MVDNTSNENFDVEELSTVTYSWQVSNDNGLTFTDLVQAPNSPSLTLSNIKSLQHNYSYRLVVTSGIHQIISKPAKLIIFPDINITQHPQSQTPVNGQCSLSFSSTVSSNAQVQYQWEFADRTNPSTFTSIPNATGTVLNLSNLTSQEDDYSYRAKITAKYSNNFPNIAYTNIASIDIIPVTIVIREHPSDIYVPESDESPATFTVDATSSDGELTYQWQESSDGINYTNIPLSNNNFISILSTNKDQYKYRVIISSPNGSVTSNSATLHTSVELPRLINSINNPRLWGDPHLSLVSLKGALANLDDNCCNTPIVLFYVKYPNGDSYKLVLHHSFRPNATSGPSVVSNIILYKNGQTVSSFKSNLPTQSLQTPTNDTTFSRCTSAGLTGWDYFAGRSLVMSSAINSIIFNNSNYSQLFINSIKWLCKNKNNPNILIIGSGVDSIDNTIKNKILSMLQCSVTISPAPYKTYDTFTNQTNLLNNRDVVILIQNDLSSTKRMISSTQTALVDYVKAGGGLLVSGGVAFGLSKNLYGSLSEVLPVFATSRVNNMSPLKYIQNLPNSLLNNSIPQNFTYTSFDKLYNYTDVLIQNVKPQGIVFYTSEQCLGSRAEFDVFDLGPVMQVYSSVFNAPNWGAVHSPIFVWGSPISYSGKIRIGGALYWTIKSLIEAKKNPKDTINAAWSSVLVGPTADGYGKVLARYNISRADLSAAVNASDSSQQILKITEEIELKNVFWKNLSKLMAGLVPDDKLYSLNKVYFIKHPGDRIALVNTPSVSFDVAAGSTNSQDILYQWQVSSNNGLTYTNIRANTPGYHGSTTNKLTIYSPKLTFNNYYYRAVISSTNAQPKQSNPAKLSVIQSINIINFPTQTEAIDGRATFNVTANSSDGDLKYQWQRSATVRGTFTNIPGETLPFLSVSVNSYNETYKFYRVIISNNNSSITTNPVRLVTTPSITINSQPTNFTSYTAQATFSVSASFIRTLPSTKINYQWQFSRNNKHFVNLSGKTSDTLILTNINKDNNDLYYRVVLTIPTSDTNPRPIITSYSNAAKLTVIPTVTSSDIEILPVYKKVNNIDYVDITLRVYAQTTNGTLSYQWQQSKNKGLSYTNLNNTNSDIININNIPKNSYPNYKYRVLISNPLETIIAY